MYCHLELGFTRRYNYKLNFIKPNTYADTDVLYTHTAWESARDEFIQSSHLAKDILLSLPLCTNSIFIHLHSESLRSRRRTPNTPLPISINFHLKGINFNSVVRLKLCVAILKLIFSVWISTNTHARRATTTSTTLKTK